MNKLHGVTRALIVLASMVASLLFATDGPASAAPEPRWTRRFLGSAEGVAVGPRDTTYVVGSRRVATYMRAAVARYGPRGRLVWSRRWGPDGMHTSGNAVAVSRDGGVVVAGTIQPEGLCGGWFVRAYDRDGRVRWHRERDGARTCRGFEATAAVAVGWDGIVLVGNDVSDGIGGVAGWIVAFSLDGQVRWQRRLALPGVPTSWYDDLSDVAIDQSGAIYVVGATAPRRDDGTNGSYRRVVQKMSSSGRVIWSRVFDDRGRRPTDIDRVTSVSIVGGRLAVGGYDTKRGWENPVAWVARLSPEGKVLAEHLSRGGGRSDTDVALTPQGRTFVVFETREGTLLMKLGPGLGSVWRTVLPHRGGSPTVSAGGTGVSTSSNGADWRVDRIWHFHA